jgi:hypothetical protein
MNLPVVPVYIFNFKRYVQQFWYFNLKPKSNLPYWIDYRLLTKEEKSLIVYDSNFKTQEAGLRDAAYQAWQKGIMHNDPVLSLKQPFEPLDLIDEYRFIKKYFNTFWSSYIFLLRLILLVNPFKEIAAFSRSRSISRVDMYSSVKAPSDYAEFDSELVREEPLISIIIPTLNRQIYLEDVLLDLSKQSYENFEVIIVDQNEDFDEDFYAKWSFNLQAIHQSEKALWLARNRAIQISRGEFVLLFDDDSRVEPDWIEQHIKCLDYFNCQLSAGVSISLVGAKVPKNYEHFRWADQLDTGNVMIKKEVFKSIGLFDRQFERQRMGDGEFGLRSFLAGFKSVSNPIAKRLHLKVGTGGLRQMGSWDGFRPNGLCSPRPVPSVLYLTRRYFGTKASIFDLMIKVPPSIVPLRYKRKPVLLLAASAASIILSPLLFYQVVMSWKIATSMIKNEPVIDDLN